MKRILYICLLFFFASCSPKIIEHTTVTEIEYRDRIVHDTATVEIFKEIEKNVTRDTMSHLENTYAKSDAMVSQGLLHHSLESKPQVIKVPVEVHVTDTSRKESEVRTEIVEVEKKLSKGKQLKLDAFWPLLGGLAAALAWIFRKPLGQLIKKLLILIGI